jgi:CBS domain containing-hemolysin-like protein
VLARLSIIVVLLVLNGYFVAVEFALVRARRSRLQAMVRAGDPIAKFAVAATGNLARVLSASQIGITAASLALGWVAESAVGHAIAGVLGQLPLPVEAAVRVTIGTAIALLAVTYLHVVFGELAPRSAALTHPETFAKWLAPPLLAWAWLMTPFIAVLNRSAAGVLALFGQRFSEGHEAVHSPDELRILVEQSEERGALGEHDAELIDAVFEFSEKTAREVMTPRTDVVALAADAPLERALVTVRESGFSRFPVYEGTIDDIVGMAHARDLLWAVADGRKDARVRDVMRGVHVVPGTRDVEDVLADFKRLKEHLAIVLDEFGGTAGVVTMEDLLEEIVGEIRDEFDETTEMPAPHAAPGETLLQGATPITEVNERYGLAIPDTDYTTIGGFLFGALGRLPVAGDRVEAGGATWGVRSMVGRRIGTVALERIDAAGA